MRRQAWPIHVPMLDDELLSTWLVRVALGQGCDPLIATSSMWPKWRAWTRDLDRHVDPERLRILAECTGIAQDRLADSSMWHWVKLMSNQVKPESSNWPWLLPLGTRNRSHRGGLQFCPECLKTDKRPYFRRLWRMAWIVACPIHGCLMLDRCGACRRPVEPQKAVAMDGAIDRCPHCKSPYAALSTPQADREVLDLQVMCLEVLSSGQGEIGGVVYSSLHWFEIYRKLVVQNESAMLATTGISLNRQLPGLAFELKDLNERVSRILHACHAMQADAAHPALIRALRELEPKRIKRSKVSAADQLVGSRRIEGPAPEVLAKARWARLLRRLGLPME